MRKLILSLFICTLLISGSFVTNDNLLKAETNKYLFTDVCSKAIKKSGDFKYNSEYDCISYKYDYDENWFDEDAYSYNHDLAIMSLDFAMAAFGNGENLKDLYNQLGYTYTDNIKDDLMDSADSIVYTDTYINFDLDDPSKDTIGYGIAYKNVELDSGKYTIIQVSIRGGGYYTEWSSNFTLGDSGDHYGFSKAALEIKTKLYEYIETINSPYPIKLWTVGYSRAAAVANLLGHYINVDCKDKTGKLLPENNYSFCFETPMGAIDSSNVSYSYKYKKLYDTVVNLDDNDYVLNNPLDLITMTAMDDMGFSHYGNVKNFPNKMTSSNYYSSDYYNNMLKKYQEIINYNGIENSINLTEAQNQRAIFENFTGLLSKLFDYSRTKYKVDTEGENFARYMIYCFMVEGAKITSAKIYYFNSSGNRVLKKSIDVEDIIEEDGDINILNASLALTAMIMLDKEKSYEIEVYTDSALKDHSSIKLSRSMYEEIRSLLVKALDIYKNNTIDIDAVTDSIAKTHYPELCLSWMESIKSKDFNNNKQYRLITLDTSSTAYVYYQDTIVGQLTKSSITTMSQSVEAYDSEDSKIVIKVPNKDGYKVKISSSSISSCTIQTYNINTNELIDNTVYENLGSGTYNLLLDEDSVILKDSNNNVKNKVTEEHFNDKTIIKLSVTNDAKKGSITGEGTYNLYDFASLSSSPKDGYLFEGWYVGDTKISDEATISYRVDLVNNLICKYISYEDVLKDYVTFETLKFRNDETVGFKIDTTISSKYLNNIKIHYSIDSKEYTLTPDDENYSFNIDVNLSNLDSKIEVWASIKTVSSNHLKTTLSDYYKTISSSDKKLNDLVSSLLDYQENLDNYNKGNKIQLDTSVTKDNVKKYTYTVSSSGNEKIIKLLDVSLTLDDYVGIKIYFKTSGSYTKDSFTFLVNNKSNDPNVTIGNDYILIDKIYADKLDTPFNIKIKQGTNTIVDFNYSVMSYVYEVLKLKDSKYDNLKNLCISIYNYSKAYEEYQK